MKPEKKLLLTKIKNVLVVFLRNKVCEKTEQKCRKNTHINSQEEYQKNKPKWRKKMKKCVELKKDNMECWYSADSWEKKKQSKKPNKL